MNRTLFALLALFAVSLCACSSEPAGTATVSTSPSLAPTAAAFDGATAEKAVIELEKKTWGMYQDRKPEEYRKYFVPNYQTLYFGGAKNLDDVLNDSKNVVIASIDFSDWKVTFPTNETAVVTYKYTSKGNTYKGKDISGTNVALATYAKIGGEWKTTSYSEMKAEAPAPAAKK